MTLRLGLLAASRIAAGAVMQPVGQVEGVEVSAVAARSADRADAAALRWEIDRSFESYQAMLDSDAVDAVYVSTPASLHRPWTIAALEAGKHVLVEKPLAANVDDAQLIADAAANSDLVVMEAMHWRYHPLAAQMTDVMVSGQLGDVQRIEARFEVPRSHIPQSDIRYVLELGGGAMMDIGCYPISWVRHLLGEPTVVSATATCPIQEIDGDLKADLAWPGGASGSVLGSMIADEEREGSSVVVTGSDGVMYVDNPLAPQRGARLAVKTSEGESETPVSSSSTYVHQLEAFRDAVVHGSPFVTTAADGVLTMAIIDQCYRKAGLPPRPTLV